MVIKSGIFRKVYLDFCVDIALFVLGYSRTAGFEAGSAALGGTELLTHNCWPSSKG